MKKKSFKNIFICLLIILTFKSLKAETNCDSLSSQLYSKDELEKTVKALDSNNKILDTRIGKLEVELELEKNRNNVHFNLGMIYITLILAVIYWLLRRVKIKKISNINENNNT